VALFAAYSLQTKVFKKGNENVSVDRFVRHASLDRNQNLLSQ
jgi:hypothetical protein